MSGGPVMVLDCAKWTSLGGPELADVQPVGRFPVLGSGGPMHCMDLLHRQPYAVSTILAMALGPASNWPP